jgi:hypothetical protein
VRGIGLAVARRRDLRLFVGHLSGGLLWQTGGIAQFRGDFLD